MRLSLIWQEFFYKTDIFIDHIVLISPENMDISKTDR